MSARPPRRVAVVTSHAAPPGAPALVEAALRALGDVAEGGLEIQRLDVGRVGQGTGSLGRVVHAILGEVESRRLERELALSPPDVAVAFEPGAAAVLVTARDRAMASGGAATPVVGVVSDLAPRAEWALDCDRFAVVDDEAAVALAERGVDGARIVVVGPLVPRAFHDAGDEPRAELRAHYNLPTDVPVLLVDAAGLGAETMSAVTVQLALFERRLYVLFDAGADGDVAAQLRRQVPTLGLRAKLFGQATADAPRLWRAADAVLARPRARAVAQALAVGAGFVSYLGETEGAVAERDAAEAQALLDRGCGVSAPRALVLAGALEPLRSGHAEALAAASAARGRLDGPAGIAELVREVAEDREAVLAETLAAAAAAVAAGIDEAAPAPGAARGARGGAGAPSGIEDLDDFGDTPLAGVRPAGPDPAMRERLSAELGAAEARARRELEESRSEAEKWDARRTLAETRGDARLAAEASREGDRKRARMHAALEELGRLTAERAKVMAAGHGGGEAPRSSFDEELSTLKERSQTEAQAKGRKLDDELGALKRKMDQDRGGKKR